VRLLLDTHAFYWWLAGSPRLSTPARRAIGDPANVKFVSAASAWEFVTKFRTGREPAFATLAADVVSAIASQGFAELALSVRHAELAAGLPLHHRDPFDRMLIAQSLLDNVPIVTGDPLFRPYGCMVLW
jgi:PIN domain nuclease of toxin-antitoxin system